MTTIFIQIGLFCISLVIAIYFQVYPDRKKMDDCRLFSRLLLATLAILVIDTVGWIIDGHPIAGQVWITTIIDGIDLFCTTLVCWYWVQYADYIAMGTRPKSYRWYKDFITLLLIAQAILVLSSQIFGFYYSVDAEGCYQRERGYIVHSIISVAMLVYSSVMCIRTYYKSDDEEKKKECFFVAFIIVVPILGNMFQYFVYGYPTVWLCMVVMVFIVYIHIQNKRINTEREKQNKKLQKALDQAQLASSAKTDFLSHMSHDMRTPMNAILGITSLLRDRTNPVEIRADVDQIERSGKYLLSLINDTLDMNKIESGKLELHPEPVNSENLLANVLATAQILAQQKGVRLVLELEYDKSEDIRPVIADSSRVEQIFMNVISNAIKFTPAGGSVTLRMETVSIDDETITDKYIVTDTGIGMSDEFQKHLFEPFVQEGRTNIDHESGTGLGLAIVKQIVELMGGSIKIESKLNKGTKIIIEISYQRYHGEIEVLKNEMYDLSVLKGKRVLLCEDHPINAQIATRLLDKQGIKVEHAQDGQAGLDMFKASKENYYDAILMDIRMPVMNGIEAAKAIRNINNRDDAKNIPIIAMTANAFDEDIRQSREAGMNAHLPKPIEPEKLFSELAKQILRT